MAYFHIAYLCYVSSLRSPLPLGRGGLSPSPAVSQSEQSVSCHHFSRYEPYITYIVYRTIQSFHLETFIQFASSVNSHSIRFNTRLGKITTSSAVYEFGCCLNFYQTSEYCNNLRHIHIRYVRDCSIDNLYTYSMRR